MKNVNLKIINILLSAMLLANSAIWANHKPNESPAPPSNWMVVPNPQFLNSSIPHPTPPPPPNWTVNSANFQYSMNAVVQFKFNSTLQNQTNNLVGVFVGNELRGVAAPIIISGVAYYFISIYSNAYLGDVLTFRAYRGTSDKIYGTTSQGIFQHNAFIGSFAAPFTFNTSSSATILTSNAPVCLGTNLELGILPSPPLTGYTYAWSGPNGYSATGVNPAPFAMSAVTVGTYVVTTTNTTGTTSTTSIIISMASGPSLTATSNSPLCSVNAVQLNSLPNGGSGTFPIFSWTGPNGFSSNLRNPLPFAANNAIVGNYQVTVTDTKGCSATAQTAVSIVTPPILATSNGPLCLGDSAFLVAGPVSAGATYLWSGPNNYTSTSRTPAGFLLTNNKIGNYTTKVTLSGCSATETTSLSLGLGATPPLTTDNGLRFDGTNDFVKLGVCGAESNAVNSTNAVTVEYWFKGPVHQSAVRFQPTGSSYLIAGYNGTHVLSNDGGTSGGISAGATVNDNNWHHVAFTWQRNTVNGFKSYLDGVLVAQRNSSNSALPVFNANLFLGALNGTSEYMRGTLDDVRVWNVSRTQAQIQANMHCEMSLPQTGLRMYFKFNHGTRSTSNANIKSLQNHALTNSFNGVLKNFELTGANSNWVAPKTGNSLVCPAAQTVNTAAGVCTQNVTYTLQTANCPGETLVQTSGLASGSNFPVGVTTNNFTVTSASGTTATCSFTVTVVDNIAPIITCPANITTNNTANLCSKVVTFTAATATDNCGTPTISLTGGLPSGSSFPVGTTINIYQASDAGANTATCSFTVQVLDATLPTLTCPANQTYATAAAVNIPLPSAITDNCAIQNLQVRRKLGTAAYTAFLTLPGGSVPTGPNPFNSAANGGTYSPPTGIGTWIFQYRLYDINGNLNTCIFNVTVTANAYGTVKAENRENSPSTETQINIFPNPTEGAFLLQIQSIENQPVAVEAYDFFGRIVRNISARTDESGALVFSQNWSDLGAGAYLLRVLVGESVYFRRVVIGW